MLAGSRMTTILPVGDLGRARAFFGTMLGLEEVGLSPDGKLQFAAGGGILALILKPEPTPAEHTAVSFEVDDVAEAIRVLEKNGVHFEDYDLPGLKTVNHVCVLGSEKAAWFKDPDGNILCLHEVL
jgi:catechol 2,3-dioxygenase-like lactoylglutathione lyase family enzyme